MDSFVRLALGASIFSTLIHYTDNYIQFDAYPQPEWLEQALVFPVWAALTAIGIWGYVLYRRGEMRPAANRFMVHSVGGLSSLGHYLYGSFDDFTSQMHVLILADGATGALVLGCALWMLRSARQRPAEAT